MLVMIDCEIEQMAQVDEIVQASPASDSVYLRSRNGWSRGSTPRRFSTPPGKEATEAPSYRLQDRCGASTQVSCWCRAPARDASCRDPLRNPGNREDHEAFIVIGAMEPAGFSTLAPSVGAHPGRITGACGGW